MKKIYAKNVGYTQKTHQAIYVVGATPTKAIKDKWLTLSKGESNGWKLSNDKPIRNR